MMVSLKAHLNVPSTSPFFVSGTFDLFDVMCKQRHRTVLNPFFNGMKNGDIDGNCKRSLKKV